MAIENMQRVLNAMVQSASNDEVRRELSTLYVKYKESIQELEASLIQNRQQLDIGVYEIVRLGLYS